MRLSFLFLQAAIFLVYPALIGTTILYLYPFFFGCAFPAPERTQSLYCAFDKNGSGHPSTIRELAPFRLLVLGDPQLEGDSSLPSPEDTRFPSVRTLYSTNFSTNIRTNLKTLKSVTSSLLTKDVPLILWSYRKRLDLLGNDYYLAHIYRTLHWYLKPTHVAVLGDLIGSQWVTDEEFGHRAWRYWNRVFRGGRRVEDDIMEKPFLIEPLGYDTDWSRRIINVAGNHDIGYAGDIDRQRMERFGKAFGKPNWDIKFQLFQNGSGTKTVDTTFGGPPELRVIVLNSMNLDGPARDQSIQGETYNFINEDIIGKSRPVEDRRTGTIVLTHIPLHKREGVCVDGPFIDIGVDGIQEQNHLSVTASKAILDGILGMSGNSQAPGNGMGRNGIILTGHDHEGCDISHFHPFEDLEWQAKRWTEGREVANRHNPSVREVTVRSMMGAYGGNAGLLSAWFDYDIDEWRFQYATCAVGVQHFWWAAHVLDSVTALLFLLAGFCWMAETEPTEPDAIASSKPCCKL